MATPWGLGGDGPAPVSGQALLLNFINAIASRNLPLLCHLAPGASLTSSVLVGFSISNRGNQDCRILPIKCYDCFGWE